MLRKNVKLTRTTMKEVLILDFDGVIAITEHLWIEYINKKYGIFSKKEDYNNGMSLEKNVNILTGLNLSFEAFYYDFTENFTMSRELHKNVSLLPHAPEVIREVAKKYALFISTARNALGRDVVKYVLERHNILQHFIGFHFIYSFGDKMEFVKIPKAKFIARFNGKASFFVDDSHQEIEKAKKIVPSILFDTTGNRVLDQAWTVNDWIEVGDLVL